MPNPGGGSPLETTVSYTSSLGGWKVTATDPLGRDTLIEHDFLGRAFRTTLPSATTGADQAIVPIDLLCRWIALREIDP